MTTLNDLIYQIYEDLQISSDDTTIDRRLVEDLIKNNRAIWLRNHINKHNYIDDNILQAVYFKLEIVDRIDSGCEQISSGCTILRSTQQIPNAIELNNQKAIARISSLDILGIPIDFIEYDHAIYWGNGRFNRNRLAAFIKSNYLYIIHNENPEFKLLEKIKAYIVAEDPRELENYTNCETNESCWTSNSRYPLNLHIWQQFIKPNVLNELVSKKQFSRDPSNNSNDDQALAPRQARNERKD